jgi:hypothetical protein
VAIPNPKLASGVRGYTGLSGVTLTGVRNPAQ